ncbi:hypothetical protein HYALB_00001984 [Hymenoscyphus albidus]|uniref:Actin-like ATPase domain-containing protein n=1 Tax=Hymenoscyphus albidus TaxID=595503 RepID=A0A9N9LHY8_9HELO|nr:hypothetical protein HYALB_00001984 [Hymenoscyphus albidus]
MASIPVRPKAHKLIIAVDFGTTFSSIAYVYTSDPNEQKVVKSWPDSSQSTEFVPSTIRYNEYDPETTPPKWGYQLEDDELKHEWFKLGLYPALAKTALAENYPSHTAFPPVYGKECEKMVTDYLRSLKKHAEKYIAEKLDEVFLKGKKPEYIVTVPAVWSDQAQATTRRCAENAGMGSRNDMQIITEPEAAGIYALKNMKLGLNVHDTFVLCDAGGGTVDLISYTVAEVGERPLIYESAPGSGSLCGSTFLNRIFDHFLRRKFANYPKWDEDYHKEAMHRFEIKIKREFNGDLNKSFFIPARGLSNNLLLGIQSGKVEFTGRDLAEVFEPVMKEIVALVAAQIHATDKPVKAILLAGGFGSSNYLKKRIEKRVGGIKVVQIEDGDTAIVRGALIRGLVEKSPGLASVRIDGRVARRYYGALAGVPFDPKRHDSWRKERDGLFGGDRVQEMNWFVKKGALIRGNDRPSFGFYWSEEVFPGYPPTIELTLYKCDDSKNEGAPLYADGKEVQRFVKLKADVRSMMKEFKQELGDNGKMYYKLDFDLEIEYQSGSLKFSILYNGKRYDTATAEFE